MRGAGKGVADIYDLLDKVEQMGEDEFWEIVAESRAIHESEGLGQDEALGQLLAPMEAVEVARYFKRFRREVEKLDTDEVYEVLGGSDDGFADARAWAVSMGREYCERLRSNPASLRGSKTQEFEVFAYVPALAAERGADRLRYLAAGLARVERAQLVEAVEDPRRMATAKGRRI